ncbi:MAG: hypothetical protein HFE75_14300 [Firmicutes bacterium]|jgi:lysine-ketoglutarate reductase/saccharopine dehydrogenase-like protein (TIGR00300 family)|nr:hypothetical protein [Bacillota bacterium]NBI61575.1 hypothetical protein [Clostridiales bacterium]
MSFQLREYIEPDFNKEKFSKAPDARLQLAPKDMTAPEGFHATSIFPEYFKIDGNWLLAEDSRMDCVAVYENGKIYVREFRNVKQGDRIVVGRTEDCEDGIYVHADCFARDENKDAPFSFRQSRSRETAFSYDYEQLYDLLKHERKNGYIVWVLGPACAFDAEARTAFSKLIAEGYVDALLAGNALATHDLEASLLGTALGQDIKTQRPHFNGHYNHIDTINKVNLHGSIPAFLEEEGIEEGIMYSCVKHGVPYVLNGSLRDDGPLPEVYEHTYVGQDAVRSHVRKATTVIGMATVLHTIATGNMTPNYRVMPDGTIRQIYFYTIDTSEFAVNKLGDRGSLAARGIVTNVQDFVCNLAKGLNL